MHGMDAHALETLLKDLGKAKVPKDTPEELAKRGPYVFPYRLEPRGEKDLPDAELLRRLSEAVSWAEGKRPDFPKFDAFRLAYSRFALELNRRGRLAPAFRPRLAVPELHKWTPSDKLFALDLQVIDLHWWFCNGGSREIAGVVLKSLFRTDGSFDFEVAEGFATKSWKMDKKGAALRLTPDEKWLMAGIRDEKNAEGRRKVKKQIERQAKTLRQGARIIKRRAGLVENWVRVLEAEAIAYYASVHALDDDLLLPMNSSRIMYFYNLMTGKDVRRQTVEKVLSRAKAALGVPSR